MEHLEHLGAREQEWVALTAAEPAVTFRVEFRNDPRRGLIFAERVRPLGSAPSILIGDVLNNLRGALDYIAWQLYIRGAAYTGADPEVDRLVAWPLVRKRKGWDYAAARKLPGVSAAALAQVEALQPYNGHLWSPALRWLADVHGHEKHRDLRPGLIVLPDASVRVDPGADFQGRVKVSAPAGALTPGTLLAEVRPGRDAQFPLHMTVELAPRLGLEDGVPVLQHLQSLAAATLGVLRAAELWLLLGHRDDVDFMPVVPPTCQP